MAGKKIMIVDDDKEFLEEIKETLTLTGYDVTAVSESPEAVKVARDLKPDLILLDLKMHAKSGFQIADDLKHIPETSNIPVIAMTGFYTAKEHTLLINSCGITKCLKKPFNPLDVIAEIEHTLKKNNRSI